VPSRAAAADASGEAALTGHFLAGKDVLGGGAITDVTLAVGPVRFGGAIGAAAFSSDVPEKSRAFMPLAFSLGVVFAQAIPWASMPACARACGGGGVSDRLTAGGFFSTGAFLTLRLSERARFAVGADGWFLLGGEPIAAIAPGAGFAWSFGGAAP
jgi:hypothetical protein